MGQPVATSVGDDLSARGEKRNVRFMTDAAAGCRTANTAAVLSGSMPSATPAVNV